MFKHIKALLKWKDASPRARRYRLFCLACALLILICAAYIVYWYSNQNRIEADGISYSALYSPAPLTTTAPAAASTADEGGLTANPQAENSPTDSAGLQTDQSFPEAIAFTASPLMETEPQSAPAASPATLSTASGMATAGTAADVSPTPSAGEGNLAANADAQTAPAASAAQTPAPTATPQPRVVDETLAPLATPDENTVVYALPTNPPPQESFSQLLLYNPDTVGYLMIGDIVDLPVVQRENDNEYYLTHGFSGAEAREGALFLDGANRLGDENLIVYGHNMRNGTMFGQLSSFGERDFLLENAVVRFDTLYENALYVPFAMFEASMDEDDAHYFDVRQIVFDETTFELFVLRLRSRSVFDVPVDVAYGDQLLTLVTCSYNDEDGRYIVALRKLRAGETEEDVRALMKEAQ